MQRRHDLKNVKGLHAELEAAMSSSCHSAQDTFIFSESQARRERHGESSPKASSVQLVKSEAASSRLESKELPTKQAPVHSSLVPSTPTSSWILGCGAYSDHLRLSTTALKPRSMSKAVGHRVPSVHLLYTSCTPLQGIGP